jgi:Na+/proline symporter/signal transduction histidine kinase
MNYVDFGIIVAFLGATLIVGMGHGRTVKDIRDYALGGRNFSTGALVATIVATYASGSAFFATLTKTYTDGFYYVFASVMGLGIEFFIMAFILIPRAGEFLGKVSIAEAMGDLYGNKVRLITAIAGTIGAAGSIAVQFKVFGNIFSYFSGVSPFTAIVVSGLITTFYSAFGGIRAVTFTDILQGFAFGMIVPLLGFAIWNEFYDTKHTIVGALSAPKFSLSFLYDPNDSNFLTFILLLLYLSIPTVSASTFQRISMGSSIEQVKKAFIYSAIISILIKCAVAWIPFIVHTLNPDLGANSLLGYIVDEFSFTGMKGLVFVAIVAFAMSTADSKINSSSVLFTHDIYGLFAKNKNKELLVAKIFAFSLGGASIFLSLVETDLLRIIILSNSFYVPAVCPVLFLTLSGFRSSSRSVLIGMGSGLIVTTLWKFLPSKSVLSEDVIGILVAMLANVIALFTAHYYFGEPGGWVGIKDKSYLRKQAKLRARKRHESKKNGGFDFGKFCEKIAPKSDITYTTLGLYFIACTITTMYSTQIELTRENGKLMQVIYPFMLITGTTMSMYQIWPLSIPERIKKVVIESWYPFAVFYMLIFFSCFFVLVSQFAMLQMALFSMNLIVVTVLLGWRFALPTIAVGFSLSVKFYEYFFKQQGFAVQFGSPEFVLIYIMIFFALVVIFFLKPEQEYLAQTEEKVEKLQTKNIFLGFEHERQMRLAQDKISHYNEKIFDQREEIYRLGTTTQRILNNVNHELRVPIGNVMNFAEMINESLSKQSDHYLQDLSQEVLKNSKRLSTMILNMLDLAMLQRDKLELDKKVINFSQLVEERVKECRKIYLSEKKINMDMQIDQDIMLSIDANYMRQAIDNLVINAINFSKEGTINITLKKNEQEVVFTIEDEGDGIPVREIYDIFIPFKMSSRHQANNAGRGVGLALCRAAVNAHGGEIKARSNGIRGAKFTFTLPLTIKKKISKK